MREQPDLVVEATGIVKSFAGVQALRGVDLHVRRGDIHALLGQNGAGKSTLVKILNGIHPAGSFDGAIRINGAPVTFQSPAQARKSGIAFVPQEIEVFEHLSVAENVFAGQTGLGRKVLVDHGRLERGAAALFRDFGLAFNPRALVATLTAAQRHLIMIVRALATRPALLMLDEPTASLSGAEVARLFGLLLRLKGQGATTIFITHRLPEVMTLCDRATVLRDGRIAAEFQRAEFDEDALISAMSGERLQRLYPAHEAPVSAPSLLRLEGVSVQARDGSHADLHDISFDLKAGEILGIAGLLGSGRTELLSAIYGRLPFHGRIHVRGEELAIRSTRDARHAGIALVTEDRKRSGLLFNLLVGRNITIGNLRMFARAGVVRSAAERLAAIEAMRALDVRARSPDAMAASLSGGNQQKLLMARVLMSRPKVLLLDEPTKGVDVGTRAEIYRLIVALAATGVGLIMVSSELEEVLGVADRCLVLADGRLVDEFARGEGTEPRVLKAIAAAQAVRTLAAGVAGP